MPYNRSMFRLTGFTTLLAGGLFFGPPAPSYAINIAVDYQYDTNHFFDSQEKTEALEAAARRFSQIITTSLNRVELVDDATDARIGFQHPANGNTWDVSPAVHSGSDALPAAGGSLAQEYRGPWSIPQDTWILYAGGRPFSVAGQGGTGTGVNFGRVFSDGNSILNRGFRASGTNTNLPVWGGVITFDSDNSTNWHFDIESAPPAGTTDLYSVALHEIGHALGLNTSWQEWSQWTSGGAFTGPHALAAYNADNTTNLTALSEVNSINSHWHDGSYDSKIFTSAGPNLIGSVGEGNLQDLLMEPIAHFTPTITRFELTNVDVAALRDVGWAVVPEPSSLALVFGACSGLLVCFACSRQPR